MKAFSDLLREYIKVQNLTIYSISKESGIDRSFLQGILSGRKKLPLTRFEQIVNSDNFTLTQIQNLCNSYFSEIYDSNKMTRFEYIEHALKGNIKKTLLEPFAVESTDIISEHLYSGKTNVYNAVYSVLLNCGENIATNFPFEITEINKIVYQFCKQKQINNFFHYVSPNKGTDCHNLQIFFNSIHYAEIGYLTHIYKTEAADEFLPYFILTDNHLIKFDINAENAFILNSDEVLDFFRHKLKSIKNICTSNIHFSNDVFDYMNFIHISCNHGLSENIIYCFDNSFCATKITKEIINEIATPLALQLPNIENEILAHYQFMRNTNECFNTTKPAIKQIISYDSLERFVKTGILEDYPAQYANPVPLKYRAELLEATLNDTDIDFQITNSLVFSSDYKFSYEFQNNSFIFTPVIENYLISYTSQNDVLISDFRDFTEYFNASIYTYSPSKSRLIMGSFIDNLRALDEDKMTNTLEFEKQSSALKV